MATIIGFVLAALVLIFFEVILPGGILGILAVACIIIASWFGFADFGPVAGISVFLGSLLAAAALVYIEFKFVAKTPLGRSFFLRTRVEGHSSAKTVSDEIVGKSGETLTRLNPTGMVEIEGRPYEAFSQDGLLDRGQSVEVVSKDNFRLIVKKS